MSRGGLLGLLPRPPHTRWRVGGGAPWPVGVVLDGVGGLDDGECPANSLGHTSDRELRLMCWRSAMGVGAGF